MNKAILIAASGVFALGACSAQAPEQADASPAASLAPAEVNGAGDAPAAAQPTGTIAAEAEAEAEAPASSPAGNEAQKGAEGARTVLLEWAQALEHGDFGRAWEQFGNPPATRENYVRWWQRYRSIKVAVSPGSVEGAAGSLYYSSRATLTGLTQAGKPFRISGPVILRRVNDVPGATPKQLRWHIESAVLEDESA